MKYAMEKDVAFSVKYSIFNFHLIEMNFGMSNFSYCDIYRAKLEFSNFPSLGNIT